MSKQVEGTSFKLIQYNVKRLSTQVNLNLSAFKNTKHQQRYLKELTAPPPPPPPP